MGNNGVRLTALGFVSCTIIYVNRPIDRETVGQTSARGAFTARRGSRSVRATRAYTRLSTSSWIPDGGRSARSGLWPHTTGLASDTLTPQIRSRLLRRGDTHPQLRCRGSRRLWSSRQPSHPLEDGESEDRHHEKGGGTGEHRVVRVSTFDG